MTRASFIESGGNAFRGGISAEAAGEPRPSRDDAAPTVAFSLCCTHEPSANHEQIRQRRRDFQAMQVLRQAAVADLLESEDPLDHPDAVLDLRAHSGLVAVLHLHRLIDPL